MKLEVKNIIENEDGSADVQLDLDAEATKLLLQEGFLSILAKGIAAEKTIPSKKLDKILKKIREDKKKC